MASADERTLVGREAELRVLTGLLDGVHEHGGALIVRGEAGIGKSALLSHISAAAQERGFRLLSASGVQCEIELPFGGLHQLLRPILDKTDALPAPQRAALEAAFGVSAESAPELFLIALATLNLLCESATESPLVAYVEDAHWLDPPTRDVLTFVARRLESDPILLLVALRNGYDTSLERAGLPDLVVGPLSSEAASALLESVAQGIGPESLPAILSAAEGNPLAIVELPHTPQGGVGARPGELLSLNARLEEAFMSRVGDLPERTRTLLLVAAADDEGDTGEIRRASERLDPQITIDDFTPAVSAGLISIHDATLRFRHPLVRSAVYGSARPTQRQAAHRALAHVLAGNSDRRAWQLAACIVGHDEAAAVELEKAAERAVQRGALAIAMHALARAAALSPEHQARIERLLTSALLASELGRMDYAKKRMKELSALPLDETQRMRVKVLEAIVYPPSGAYSDATPGIVQAYAEAGERIGTTNPSLAFELMRVAVIAGWWTEPTEDERRMMIATADRIFPDDNDIHGAVLRGAADPIRQTPRVAAAAQHYLDAGERSTDLDSLLGQAMYQTYDIERGVILLKRASDDRRRQGRLRSLPFLLSTLADFQYRLGQFSLSATTAEEAVRVSLETNHFVWVILARTVQALVAAVRGDVDSAEVISHGLEEQLFGKLVGATFYAMPVWAAGVASLAAGRYGEAYDRLLPLFQKGSTTYHYMDRFRALSDFAEATAHSGNPEEGRRVLTDLAPLVAMTPASGVNIPFRYARAVLAEDGEAEPLFVDALAADLTRWPFERARLLLEYGAWLRRARRVAESRGPLRASRELFDTLGAKPWGERARTELRAAGEASKDRVRRGTDDLTPQERQIAELAAQGLSNREISEQMFLSPRTIGSHLYHAYPKLGIASRSQLVHALAT